MYTHLAVLALESFTEDPGIPVVKLEKLRLRLAKYLVRFTELLCGAWKMFTPTFCFRTLGRSH